MAEKNILDNLIIHIVQNNIAHEQIDIQKELEARGHAVPQATLSRKLKKLKIAKIAGIYKIVDFNSNLLPIILHMKISDFGLIVLHTNPGQANGLAYYFDQKYVNNKDNTKVLGTIAGDDTLLLIIKSKKDVDIITNEIKNDFPYL